jgi:hypothetical protein
MKAAEKVNIAMIGRGFMGKAHALAQAAMPMFFWPAPAILRRSKRGSRSIDERA